MFLRPHPRASSWLRMMDRGLSMLTVCQCVGVQGEQSAVCADACDLLTVMTEEGKQCDFERKNV